jgi:hypothetical protein
MDVHISVESEVIAQPRWSSMAIDSFGSMPAEVK